MEFELNKEMDSLLRHEARRGGFFDETSAPHLDADEISAFAENALPSAAKSRVTEHLADCGRCRTMLATVVTLNSGAESESIHIKESEDIRVTPDVSWFRRLFSLPKVTYALTAMVLMFTAAIALIALRSLNQNNSVASIEKMPETVVPEPTDGGAFANDDSKSANKPVANAASVANTAANAVADADAATRRLESDSDSPMEPSSDAKGGPRGTPQIDQTVLPEPKENELARVAKPGVVGGESAPEETKQTQEKFGTLKNEDIQARAQQNQNADGNILTPDTRNSKRLPPPAPITANPATENEPADTDRATTTPAAKKKEATRSVGGKTFRNVGGVWTDTAYSGGGTTSVSRGSDAYKKLDSGLQNIGNNLGGTVIVVWGGKAYRIQ